MTSEEHQQAVNKLCASLENLNPDEIPPLVHQLLQLCRDEHAVTIFLALSKYFNTNIYEETMKPIAESTKNNSEDMDTIGKCKLQIVILHVLLVLIYPLDWFETTPMLISSPERIFSHIKCSCLHVHYSIPAKTKQSCKIQLLYRSPTLHFSYRYNQFSHFKLYGLNYNHF